MFIFKFTFILLALALVSHAEDAPAIQQDCESPADAAAVCETSEGSPDVADCQDALDKIKGKELCAAKNAFGSKCETVIKVRTCKISACSPDRVGMMMNKEGTCEGYLQNILDKCQSDGRVGGKIEPKPCMTVNDAIEGYRLEFSHA